MVGVFRAVAWRRAALACGIASSLLFGWMIAFIRYDGYSRLSQVPSELTAIGAPTQSLWAVLGWLYMALIGIFGWGVWKSANQRRSLRRTGALLLVYAAFGLLWPFGTMHQRDVLAAGGGTLGDTIHVILGPAEVIVMFAGMAVAATAFGTRFRVYTIFSIILLLAFGVVTVIQAPRLSQGLPTPLIGLWERICITVFLAWIIALAIAVWRLDGTVLRPERQAEAMHGAIGAPPIRL